MIFHRYRYILIFTSFILFLTACSTQNSSERLKSQKYDNILVEEDKITNPFTGLPMDQKYKNQRPVAVMVENEYNSRPQSGLKEACIVYEALTEGGITRFLAIFLGSDIAEIGPVRSSRPYFIDYALEYDSIYVHYGASPKAYDDLQQHFIDNIDGIYDSKTFWRDNTRKSPHNAYTSTKNIFDKTKNRKFLKHAQIKLFDFHDPKYKLVGTKAENIKLRYNKKYNVNYCYDKDKKYYKRYINNSPHIDRTTNKTIPVKNIIIQFHDTNVIDDEGRLDIKTVGKGEGYYVSEGVLQKIIWKKDSRNSKTEYFYTNGQRLKIKPGNTWIQIIPKKAMVTIIE